MKQLWSKEEIDKLVLDAPEYGHRLLIIIEEQGLYKRAFDVCVVSKKILPVDPVKDAENLNSIIDVLRYAGASNGLVGFNNIHYTEGNVDTQDLYIRPAINGFIDNGDGTFTIYVQGLKNDQLNETLSFEIDDFTFDTTSQDFYARIDTCEVSNAFTGEIIYSYEL